MKPIIQVDPEMDRAIDRHFSKRKVKTSKLINPEKLFTKIIAEAQDHHEKFLVLKGKSYRNGFDNGWSMGYYEGLCKAAKVIMNHKQAPRKPRIKDEDRRILTGKELRIAGAKHRPVYYIEVHSGYDSHMDFHGKCYMEEAKELDINGYAHQSFYIGNSDIMPDLFEDSEEVSGDDGDGTTFRVCAVEGVKYE
jgi:hypothetical protein